MNDWMNDLISQCLADIPRGKYRDRTEKELRDHMRTLYLSLTEGGMNPTQARRETLRAMGEPNKLQEEYRAVWRRTLPGRMEELDHQLEVWAVGCAVMFGVHLLVSIVLGCAMIRGIALNLSDSYLRFLIPLVPALIAGAYYMNRKFQTLRHPVWQISVGLSFHWAFITATHVVTHVWLEALDDHMTFWEEFKVYVPYNAVHYSLPLALCVLLMVVFRCMSIRMKKSVAA